MDFWQKARTLAEEAAKKTQSLTIEAAKRSHDFTTQTLSSSKFSDLVSRSKEIAAEASKKSFEIASDASKISYEIASEASKKSLEIASEAVKRADQIKFGIPVSATSLGSSSTSSDEGVGVGEEEMERFGVTEDLREFVKGITANTFRDFPLQDDSEVSDIPTVSNVRQDLTEWQEKHAKIVLSTVKEISKLRYELCPRSMKERKFWRIYFILVNSHVTPYEKRYNEEAKLKSTEEVKDDKIKEISSNEKSIKSEAAAVNQKNKSTSANEQDLDVFLLGDLGESDDGPDDGDRDFDDDFD